MRLDYVLALLRYQRKKLLAKCVENSIDGIKHGHVFENRRDGVSNQADLVPMRYFFMSPKQRVVGTGRPTAWRCNS